MVSPSISAQPESTNDPRPDGGPQRQDVDSQAALSTLPPDDGEGNAGKPVAGLVLMPGAQPVPGYQLVKMLGSGGFGAVWTALGPGGVTVALKFIRLGGQVSEIELRSLELMKNIRHPHLVGISGIWQREDMLVIAMELGDRTLLDRLREAQRQGLPGIPVPELLEHMREVAEGIDYLNSIQIVHRDIKPANLLLVGGGAKVADFGLAKVLEQTLANNSGSMTPAYAAPEFFKGQASSRSDQYALAVSYTQLRGGQLPFRGDFAQLMAGHLREAPDLSQLPVSERPALARALAKDPSARWPDCRAFVQALQQAVQAPGTDSPADARDSGGPPQRLAPGRRRAVLAAFGVLVAVLAAVLIASLAGRPDSLTQMRQREIEREVANLRSAPPVVIRSHPPDYQKVDRIDAEDNSAFDILGDDRVVDLRLWKEVPPENLHELQSAVIHTRRVRMRKTKPAQEVRFQSRTSGHELFQSCLSPYPFRVVGQKRDSFVGTDRMKVRQLVVDVSSISEGTEFDLRLAGTYWNSLQTEQELWFGVIGYPHAFKASLLVLFPPDKPYKSYALRVARAVRDQPTSYQGPKLLLTGPGRDWIYWEVPNPEAGFVYRLHWKW